MENRSFESESGGSQRDPKDNPSDPSQPQAVPPSKGRDQTEGIPPSEKMTDDEIESPPAYRQRYAQQEEKTDDLLDLEVPAPEPVEEERGSRQDPVFQRQASERQKRRSRQLAVDGPCSLRPDLPNQPLPPPEPYPDQPVDAPDPQQQPADAPDPQHQSADAPDSEQQGMIRLPSIESCGERCSAYFGWMHTFIFQLSLHAFLATWPFATISMGVVNLEACHINQFLPPLMMAVGILGTTTVLGRICLMVRDERFRTVSGSSAFWPVVLGAESVIWIFTATELYYFFEQTPSFIPGDKHYCKPKIYMLNTHVMYLSAAWMTGWLIVNSVKFFYWVSRKYEIVINYLN